MPDKIFITEQKGKVYRVVEPNKRRAMSRFFDMGLNVVAGEVGLENQVLPEIKLSSRWNKSRPEGNKK